MLDIGSNDPDKCINIFHFLVNAGPLPGAHTPLISHNPLA